MTGKRIDHITVIINYDDMTQDTAYIEEDGSVRFWGGPVQDAGARERVAGGVRQAITDHHKEVGA